MSLAKRLILIGFMIFLTVGEIHADSCMEAAKEAVIGSHSGSSRVVTSIQKIRTKGIVSAVVSLLGQSIDPHLSPDRARHLINAIKNQDRRFIYYLVWAKPNMIFLSFTDAGSCAPYDPILLKRQ